MNKKNIDDSALTEYQIFAESSLSSILAGGVKGKQRHKAGKTKLKQLCFRRKIGCAG